MEPEITALKPKRSVVVRTATFDDVDDIISTMRRAHAECDRALPEIEMPHTRHWALQIISSGMTWVAVDDGIVVGVLMCAPVAVSWSTKPCLIENMHFYVLPAYRRFPIAAKLLERAKKSSDASQLPLKLAIDFGDQPELKDRMMRFQGLTYVGGNHIYEPQSYQRAQAALPSA